MKDSTGLEHNRLDIANAADRSCVCSDRETMRIVAILEQREYKKRFRRSLLTERKPKRKVTLPHFAIMDKRDPNLD